MGEKVSRLIKPGSTLHRLSPPFIKKKTLQPVVSVLSLEGNIASGKKQGNLNLEILRKRIDKAFSPNKLASVLVRVNSPGGSAVQSDLIASYLKMKSVRHSVPLVVFVEDMAVSGGYWLACSGSKIFATRSSVVGSLGVIYFGLGLVELMEKLGMESRVITAGGNKDLMNPLRPQREEDVQIIKRLLTDVHGHFMDHVKASRGDRLSVGEDKLFTGEIWSATAALELGLIDGIQHMDEYITAQWGEEVTVLRPKTKMENFMSL